MLPCPNASPGIAPLLSRSIAEYVGTTSCRCAGRVAIGITMGRCGVAEHVSTASRGRAGRVTI